MKTLLLGCFFSLFTLGLWSQKNDSPISVDYFSDGIHHWYLDHPDRKYTRFQPTQVKNIANNLVAYQNADGGWPKNIDWLGQLNPDSVKATLSEHYRTSTLDNRNCYTQVDYLAKVYTNTGDEKYKQSALKGLNYILSLQYPNGGWCGWDVDAITFNDNVMSGVLNLLLDIIQKEPQYVWVDNSTYTKVKKSFDRGLDLTLRCQIVVNGVKTAWAQQHDHKTLAPVGARTFELVSITANESCSVIQLLMRIDNPSPQIVEAVRSGIAWLKKSAIQGIRVEKITISKDQIINKEYPYDNVVVKDKQAKPIWARYYEVDTNRPFFCTRKGQKVYSLAEVNPERRTGYAWYGSWPDKVLKEYPGWLNKVIKR